ASTSDSDARTFSSISSSRPTMVTGPTVTACAVPSDINRSTTMAATRRGSRIGAGYPRDVDGRLTDACGKRGATGRAPHPASPPTATPQGGEGDVAPGEPHRSRGRLIGREGGSPVAREPHRPRGRFIGRAGASSAAREPHRPRGSLIGSEGVSSVTREPYRPRG